MEILEKKLGNYVLVREAGRGGMSTVYEAVDARIGRTVAVKLLDVPPHLSPPQRQDLVTRLSREARAIARLSHPNIVTIYDVGEQDGHHFLVMEYLDGITLRARLDTGPLSPAEAASVLDQVASGLDAVHAQGVVHRDIKPSNVMLLQDGRVKLMDFGVARQADDATVTRAGMSVGSPAYMAPEQVRGESGTPASDLWALGVLLYEMLAGRPPFAAENIPAVLYQVAHTDAPPVPGTLPQVQEILRRALDKDPAKRYGSAGELAADFRAAAGVRAAILLPARPRQPRARRTEAGPGAARPASRGRWPAGLAALFLIGVVTVAGIATRRPASNQPAPPPAPARTQRPTSAEQPAPETKPPRTQTTARPAGEGKPTKAAPDTPKPASPQRTKVTAAPDTPDKPEAAKAQDKPRPVPAERARRKPPPPPAARKPEPKRLATRPTPRERPAPAPRTSVRGASLLGTWQGAHTRNPATLVITRQRGGTFSGTMTVKTSGASVRVAVAGSVSAQAGQTRIVLRETRVLSPSRPRSWDLGTNTGYLHGAGRQMTGFGSDGRRRYGWMFSR